MIAEPELMGRNILIVDDLPDNLRLLSKMLTQQGYKVRKAINGEMAIASCTAQPPDLILLDINMPGMNGYQVCDVLKSSSMTAQIPIIFLSTLDEANHKLQAFKSGGLDYITKPFQVEEVLARVEHQLSLCYQQNKLKEELEQLKQEVNQRQQTQQNLERLVTVDELTQLSNRRHFNDYLKQEWKRLFSLPFYTGGYPQALSLILADVDYFKLYNDTYGHLKGDQSLQKVAQAMKQVVTYSGSLVARYGGEEFAIILPNASSDYALQVAELIRVQVKALKIPHSQSIVSSYVTVSLGIACRFPDSDLSPEDLISSADKALYHAKQQGRNSVYR
ncbi:MAG: diguanylate cyclase [Roseofilum sp. SBFL]|uniref:diguanylate cyclase domain-containing protein n=1 Tax=unclassified Roseofilum TaxID=2620099 RepID=UPI001B26A31F|nr:MULTISPECIES: diguanylate cyclase [unclassified Roseofilum]MBP0015161.1 diguanylate cyclase [Roseofilum sp. SID3]MBP0023945.1 diguanylate cyclase [Roseofilum sp. SID2]MBP0039203.1 diguanylate cyclase [Roseofilum sp. SID1]MBP0043283.1 diguanylate cyclase [Roseofilum sp. SBFL]